MRLEWQGQAATASVAVYNADGRQIARMTAEMLDQQIRQGRLSSAVLIDKSPGAEARLARLLVLLACAQACAQGVACVARDCPRHPSHSSILVLDALPAQAAG
ncbi:hypothetical protein [Halothiobacillus sp. DCM-1]|uniref:hypothetical protein n=1 Tax=Halothiobacillus sp. DCM-1 TaxID=3112558 RepID=UPI00325382C4